MLSNSVTQYHLNYLLEVTPLAMALFDRDMRYIACNNRWLMEYEMPEEKFSGRLHYEVFPEISEEWKLIHQRGMQGEVISREMDCMVRADGTMHWLRWEVRPWLDEKGDVGGIIIFTEDKTQQKLAEDSLRKSETNYKLLFDAHPAPMWVYNMDTLNFIEVNDAALIRYGYTRGEFMQMNLKDIRPAEDYQKLLENVRTSHESYSFSGEWRHVDKAGNIFDVENGLGLGIVSGYAQILGVEIAINSEPGSGSTFSIQLPSFYKR